MPTYQESWWAGVDAGGTWVRVRAHRGRVIRVRRAPAEGDLSGILERIWRDWRLSPRDVGALVVATRGVWTTAERRRAERRLGSLARRVRVISDAEAAHAAALGDRAGVLILAGTGSIAIGRDDRGDWHRAGGRGPLLGDEGSAFWIGREWLRAAWDDGAVAGARAILASSAPVARIAALAPGVLRRARGGDRVARRIVAAAQQELAQLTCEAARALKLPPPWAVSWGGSLLARDPWFRAGVARAVARVERRVRWMEPGETPVRAAERAAALMMEGATNADGERVARRRGRSERRRSGNTR